MEKASLNEKQGQAFVLLPAGLPIGTMIRMKLWLDNNGIFELSARLDNGMDLQPIILEQGESGQQAVDVLQDVEKSLGKAAEILPADEIEKLEQVRNRAFENIRRGNHHEALKIAEQVKQEVESGGGGGGQDLEAKGERLIGFTEFVVREYNWAFDVNQAYQLTRLVDETRKALSLGAGEELARKVQELDQATNDLPEIVLVFIGLKGPINTRIAPVDPDLAQNLMAEVEELEETCRTNSAAFPDPARLAALYKKITEAIRKVDKVRPGGAVCPDCGKPIIDGRRCIDGHDSWIPRGHGYDSGSGIVPRTTR
jgi:hypothetical protein